MGVLMGRPHTLDREGALEKFAELWALGMLHKDLAVEFDVHPRKISEWVKRDDVKMLARKFQQDRALAIRRRADGRIQEAIDNLDINNPRDVETLLKIRHEFKFEDTGESDKTEEELLVDMMKYVDENPDAAKQVREKHGIDGDG
jgi:hypothetical protein